MEQPRRYVFRGNANGVSVHIRRPVDLLLPVQAASSLPVTGGLSESRVGPVRFGDRKPTPGLGGDATTYVSFDSAVTVARGEYKDLERAVAMTLGKLRFDEVPTRTTVSADVRNLTMIGRVKIGKAAFTLSAESTEDAEPPIRCETAALDGVAVDGYPVKVTLAPEFVSDCDTMSKLSAAAAKGKNPQCFFDAGPAAHYGFCNPGGMTLVTLVTTLAWAEKPHPEAKIEGNSIVIPNFGKVYFAEMFVSGTWRRLTMARFQLGSADGGEASVSSGDTNGSQWPPTSR